MREKINFEDLKELIIEDGSIPDQKTHFRNHSKGIALTIGFLLGVKDELLMRHLDNVEEYILLKDTLEKDENCLAIRHLNNIRSNLMLNFKTVSRELRDFSVDYKPIDKLEIFEEDFKFLRRAEIYIITGKRDINEYIKNINLEILRRIDKIEKFFPDWVKFKNIRSLFVMPSNIEDESKRFQINQSFYPFQRYFYWREPENIGYVLGADKTILEVAYSNNWEVFQDYMKVTDVSDATKNSINDFLEKGNKIQIFVDGENADPYMMASTIDGLSDSDIDKIDKIIIYYDAVHTTKAWEYFKHFVSGINVETISVERIAEDKSLVDHKLIVGVSKAVYRDNADSIILVSSDSDFWSVIDEIKDIKFMVMVQRGKCSHNFKSILRKNDIFYCYTDSFKTVEHNAFFKGVFRSELEQIIESRFSLGNANELFETVLKNSRAELSPAEKEIIYNKYIKGLKLTITSSGEFKVVIPE